MKVSGFLAMTVAAVVMACEPAPRPVADPPVRDGDCAERRAARLRKSCHQCGAGPVEHLIEVDHRSMRIDATNALLPYSPSPRQSAGVLDTNARPEHRSPAAFRSCCSVGTVDGSGSRKALVR